MDDGASDIDLTLKPSSSQRAKRSFAVSVIGRAPRVRTLKIFTLLPWNGYTLR
jgi:hypothetical protein